MHEYRVNWTVVGIIECEEELLEAYNHEEEKEDS